MAIIIPTSCPSPHQLSPHPSSPIPPPVFSGPLPNPQRSAFLFPAVRFFVSSNLLSRSLRSASSFPLFRIFVPFGPLFRSLCSAPPFLSVRSFVPFVLLFRSLCFASPFLSYPALVLFGPLPRFLRSASSFLSVRFFVSFGPLLRFLRFVSCFLWSCSTRHCLVVSSFPSLSSLPLCQVFSPLSNPTHALQHSRRCPSTFETTPFLPQEHALQRSRKRPSPPVSVSAWFRVSCKLCFTSFLPPCVGTFVCVLVKFFHVSKRLVGSFLSHRFSQMNRSLSANRGSTQKRTGPSPVPSPKGGA